MSCDRFDILLVEDNPGDIYLFRKAFEAAELDFQLTLLEDGARAIAFTRGEATYTECPRPDLILLDLNLPKRDGTEVLRAMMKAERFTDVPIVIASSLPSFTVPDKGQLRMAKYIRKPSNLDEFLGIGVIVKQVLLESRRASIAGPSSR
jgi:two-component system, chemotaxis family, response regulator Rcp1